MVFEKLLAELSEVIKKFCMERLDMFLNDRFEPTNSVLAFVPTSGNVLQNNKLAILLRRQLDLIDNYVVLNNSALIKDHSSFLFILILLQNIIFVSKLVPVVFSVGWNLTNDVLEDQIIQRFWEWLFEFLFGWLNLMVKFLTAF